MSIENDKGIPEEAKQFRVREPNIAERMEDKDRADAGLPPLDRSKPKAKHGDTIIDKMEQLDKEKRQKTE